MEESEQKEEVVATEVEEKKEETNAEPVNHLYESIDTLSNSTFMKNSSSKLLQISEESNRDNVATNDEAKQEEVTPNGISTCVESLINKITKLKHNPLTSPFPI
jgi:hypothetical protein